MASSMVFICISLVTSEMDQFFTFISYLYLFYCCYSYSLPSFSVDLSVFLELSYGVVLYIWVTSICKALFHFNYFSFNFIFTLFRLRIIKMAQRIIVLNKIPQNISFTTYTPEFSSGQVFFFLIFTFCWLFISII